MAESQYRGITHPARWNWALWLWRKFMCPREMHCFDEVLSGVRAANGRYNPEDHYLVCDACQLMVLIDSISTEYCDLKVKQDD